MTFVKRKIRINALCAQSYHRVTSTGILLQCVLEIYGKFVMIWYDIVEFNLPLDTL